MGFGVLPLTCAKTRKSLLQMMYSNLAKQVTKKKVMMEKGAHCHNHGCEGSTELFMGLRSSALGTALFLFKCSNIDARRG